ncbi:MAG: hypothetical protein ACLP22_05575 [Solirubrobacteraceae bacterium]
MLSDEELVDGLRSGLAPLRPSADLIERLRERAVADQLHNQGSRPSRVGSGRAAVLRAGGRSASIALPIGATLAIFVLALALLGHGHRPAAPRQPIPVSATAVPPGFLLPTGRAEAPLAPVQKRILGAAIPRTAKLVAQAADPRGGLPWGLRSFRTTKDKTCLRVGRLQSGTIGAIGQNGAWSNDGRFHPFALSFNPPGDCAQTDRDGHAFENIAAGNTLANADIQGSSCAPGGGVPHRPACPQSALRSLTFGLLGPDAVSITYTLDGRLYTKPTGPDGAYLIVGPPMSLTCHVVDLHGHRQTTGCGSGGESISPTIVSDVIDSVTYQDGHVCQTTSPDPRLLNAACPPVGYVAPRVPHVSAVQLASPVTVKSLRLERYCVARRPGASTFRLLCDGPVPDGYRLGPNNPAYDEMLVAIAWTARVAVTTPNSLYDAEIQYPCNQGGSGAGPIPTNVRAGQRIVQHAQIPIIRCKGSYTVSVGYVPNVGPTGSEQLGEPTPGTGGSILVGQHSFNIR